jgi:signal transduction histidine kinase
MIDPKLLFLIKFYLLRNLVRAPMNAIMGFSKLLKDSDLEKEKRNLFVDISNKSGDRLMAIINDIMDLSKIDPDQLQLELNEVNINKVLTEIIEIHKESNQLLLKKKLDLRLNLPSLR